MNEACNGTFFFGPAPWGPGEGPKGQISLNTIKFQLQSQFQRFFDQTLCVFSHMKDIKHIRRDFRLVAIFLVPTPGALGRGQKVKYHLIWITKSISKIFKPNFVYLLTNERYITYHTGFSFSRLGHAQGWDLGAPWGVGVKNFFFWNSTRFGVWVTHINGTCTSTIFWGPRPPGPLGGVKNLISEHGHVA